MFLQSPPLSPLKGVKHGFFTRKNGVSSGIYASLNCGPGSSDNPTDVQENRRRIAAAFGAEPQKLCSLYQVHGNQVVHVDASWDAAQRPKADAMVSSTPGYMLGILTADCVPVLFADAKAGVVACAHAGWKGAIGGVLEATIAAMEKLGGKSSDIHAAIGPAIGKASYEINDVFRDTFLARSEKNTVFFTPVRSGHWLFDIKGFVRSILDLQGLHAINQLENDTYIEEDAFFSYRRTTHRGEPDYGRQMSAIMLTK